MMLLFLLPVLCGIVCLWFSTPAKADTAVTGAIIAPVTPKPWLLQSSASMPTALPTLTAPPDATQNIPDTPTAVPAATLPPPSLSDWDAEEDSAVTASPTQTPNNLPGVLGLQHTSVLRVLLIGTDAYTPKAAGRSDAMILVQVDTSANDIKMVSFLRDLYVAIPGHHSARLNAAYVYGGAPLLKQTLETNFGVTVDRYLAVNFSLMAELIDRIGGVTVDVSEKERRQLNSILKFYNTHSGDSARDQLLQASGEQLLTGKQALCYSRIRKIDSDFARTDRQRKVLEGVYRTVRSLDALALAQLIRDFMPKVNTDITLTDAVALVPVLMRINDVAFEELTIPFKSGYRSATIQGMMVLVPDLDRSRETIAAFLE